MSERAPTGLARLLAGLAEARAEGDPRLHASTLPSPAAVASIVEDLRTALFPAHDGEVEPALTRALDTLRTQVAKEPFLPDHAPDPTDVFAEYLVDIRRLLASDALAAERGDPAATGVSEVLLCYPGFLAMLHHRVAHALYRAQAHLCARLVAERAHALTGIDIHPGAQIGGSFFIDHGTGVVIGETTVIGARVRVYQGVTLGAKSFPTDATGAVKKGLLRHPIVEDDVVIYAGATVLGRVRIGAGSSIGGNVWVTHDVPPHSRVTQAQSKSESFDAGGGI